MALTNMLTLAIYLDPTPGGVVPELHLKEGSTSVHAELHILDAASFTNSESKYAVIRGIRPDGNEIFIPSFTGVSDVRLQVHLYQYDVKEMAKVAGIYRCTLTLLDTKQRPTRKNYSNYNFATVLPFTVVVHEKAGRDENA